MEQTAAYWAENYFSDSFDRQEWLSHPLSQERLRRLQDNQSREEWFATKYLANGPARRAASFGAGRADAEILLLEMGVVEHFDLFDVSAAGIEFAKRRAEEKGFGHRVACHVVAMADAAIAPESYDLVMFVASLHHMGDPEPALRIVRRALKPGGLLWCANEYIGPDRFSYPPAHSRIAEAFFVQLPADLRWHDSLPLPTAEAVAAADPTEAEHSSWIEPAVRRVFGEIDLLPLYGGLAFIVFWGLRHDALYDTAAGRELVRNILAMDKSLTDCGVLPTYFAHLVARKTDHGEGGRGRLRRLARRVLGLDGDRGGVLRQ